MHGVQIGGEEDHGEGGKADCGRAPEEPREGPDVIALRDAGLIIAATAQIPDGEPCEQKRSRPGHDGDDQRQKTVQSDPGNVDAAETGIGAFELGHSLGGYGKVLQRPNEMRRKQHREERAGISQLGREKPRAQVGDAECGDQDSGKTQEKIIFGQRTDGGRRAQARESSPDRRAGRCRQPHAETRRPQT